MCARSTGPVVRIVNRPETLSVSHLRVGMDHLEVVGRTDRDTEVLGAVERAAAVVVGGEEPYPEGAAAGVVGDGVEPVQRQVPSALRRGSILVRSSRIKVMSPSAVSSPRHSAPPSA